MQKIIILFLLYAFFVSQSLIIGYAVKLIDSTKSDMTTGLLLIMSSIIAMYLFVFDTGDNV